MSAAAFIADMSADSREQAGGGKPKKKKGPKWINAKGSSLNKFVEKMRDLSKLPKEVIIAHKLKADWPVKITMWNTKVYKMKYDLKKNTTHFNFIVQHDEEVDKKTKKTVNLACNIRIKEHPGKKEGKYEIVGCEYPVDVPSEMGGGGGGFGGASMGFGDSSDGKMKTMMFMMSDSKRSDVKKKNYKSVDELKKTKDGHLIYTAMGTTELKIRDSYKLGGNAQLDTSKEEDCLTEKMKKNMEFAFVDFLEAYGDGAGKIPQKYCMEVVDRCNLNLTQFQTKRINDFMRMDKDGMMDLIQIMECVNRTFNEQKRGHFHMTVKELMDLFTESDADMSGMLEAGEIAEILKRVHLVTDKDAVKTWMDRMDKDNDAKLDFEEFMQLCKKMYRDAGGIVVANKSGPVRFNQTRSIVDSLREQVERNALQVTHLDAQFQNYEEQMEIMNTINAHSQLQKEINKCKAERQAMLRLKDEMDLQHRQWIAEVKRIHKKERAEIMSKIKFMQDQVGSASQQKAWLVENYETEMDEALMDADELGESLTHIHDFVTDSTTKAEEDKNLTLALMQFARQRLQKLETAKPGSVYHQQVHDSSATVDEYIKSQTVELEDWLLKRTEFTQNDRARYLKRVAAAKKKRDQYKDAHSTLTKKVKEVEKRVSTMDKKMIAIEKLNTKLRDDLDDPNTKVKAKKAETDIKVEIDDLQDVIAKQAKDKMELAQAKQAKEHVLYMERHKIGRMQVELGELKIMLDDIQQHKDVDDDEYGF